MRVRFFGQYLLEKGVISTQDLQEALRLQSSKKQYFGTYALRLGYLDVSVLNELLRLQKRSGRRLGELAMERGYLTKKQVNEILTKQKSDHLFLGEVLVGRDILKREDLYRHLEAYHREMKDLEVTELPEYLPIDPLFLRLFIIVKNYLTRVMDRPLKLVEGELTDHLKYATPSAAVRCTQREATFRVTLTIDAALNPLLVKGYIGIDIDEPDGELVEDALEEICNITVGNFLTFAQQSGEMWELEPPIILQPDQTILPLYGEHFYEVICAAPEGEARVSLDMGGES